VEEAETEILEGNPQTDEEGSETRKLEIKIEEDDVPSTHPYLSPGDGPPSRPSKSARLTTP